MSVKNQIDRTDWIQRSTHLSHFLAEVPPPKTVLEYLVIERFSECNARAAWIVSPQESGTFSLEASFGAFNASTFESHPPSIWGDHVLARALSNSEGHTSPLTQASNLQLYVDGSDDWTVIVQPLRPTNHERFVIGIACAENQEDAEKCLIGLAHDAPLLALYLHYLHAKRRESSHDARGDGSSGMSQSLTPRQSTILQLMSEGMKNREIAFAIGFSESTVRLETIEIYKKLGVHGRHEAIRVAVRLGLFEDPPAIAHA